MQTGGWYVGVHEAGGLSQYLGMKKKKFLTYASGAIPL